MTAEIAFTRTQKQRLLELGAGSELLEMKFNFESDRNERFDILARDLSEKNSEILNRLRTIKRRPALTRMAYQLSNLLIEAEFVEVATPALLSQGLINKMNIFEDNPIWKQIFWVDKTRCLRPMMAPNLYFLLRHLQRLWPKPIRLFEVGSCWRKESKGAGHLEEFTMLNLVELGCHGDPQKRLADLAASIMVSLGLSYELVRESSIVYGFTLDVICNGVEIASGTTGPHPLDRNWEIIDPWVGLGFGLERLCMLATGNGNVQRVGRSLVYLDGARLNI
jgi:pyrrolysyl-tRNA synthetase-like protein